MRYNNNNYYYLLPTSRRDLLVKVLVDGRRGEIWKCTFLIQRQVIVRLPSPLPVKVMKILQCLTLRYHLNSGNNLFQFRVYLKCGDRII